jgi:maleamate amidohydrolase
MSGCVRATATDAFMRDIRAMIVKEGVADRSPAILEANLFDVDQKYGDVVDLEMCLSYIAKLPALAQR